MVDIHTYLHAVRSISRQQLFRSSRVHQCISDQVKILKDQRAETIARVVSVAYPFWLSFLINSVLNLTKLRSIIFDHSVKIPVDSIQYEKSHYCYRPLIIYI